MVNGLGKSWNGDADNTVDSSKEKIFRAALKVFSEQPFKSATTRQIADEAGVDHPLIHYYYGSKEKLFEAVTSSIYGELFKESLVWIEKIDRSSIEAGLRSFIDQMVDFYLAHPEPLKLIAVNIYQSENIGEVPGFMEVVNYLERLTSVFTKTFPPNTPQEEMKLLVHSYLNITISYVGAKKLHGLILKVDSESPEYGKMVKQALVTLFLPWLKKLVPASGQGT